MTRRLVARQVFLFMATLVASIALIAAAATRSADAIPPETPSPCDGTTQPPADGTQNPDGFCSLANLGEVPGRNQMVSALIVEPRNGQRIRQNTPFTLSVKVANLATGWFAMPDRAYFSFQQTLDDTGVVQGHAAFTVQKLDGNNLPDPRVFAYFKSLNDAAVNGVLSANVEDGLPEGGLYRICVMTRTHSNQPVHMPVSQRGAQDDCIRISVG